MLTALLTLCFKENTFGYSVFLLYPNEMEISKALNVAKANIYSVMCSYIHLLKLFVKHANLIQGNPFYQKIPEILDFTMKSIGSLLEATPYYQLPIKSGIV